MSNFLCMRANEMYSTQSNEDQSMLINYTYTFCNENIQFILKGFITVLYWYNLNTCTYICRIQPTIMTGYITQVIICLSDCCILPLTLPFNITFPNTDASLSRVLQFQRWNRNWFWHSLMPILAPSPRLTITPGCIRQRRRWRPASPGMLSHNTPAPTAWSGN